MSKFPHKIKGNRPLKIISLPVELGFRIRVFIWENHEDMYYALRDKYKGEFTFSGFFRSKAMTLGKDDKYYPKGNVVGDIHLIIELSGAGVFAHELQHFIQDWIENRDYDPRGEGWEKIAHLAGDITADYWRKFYKHFERLEPK